MAVVPAIGAARHTTSTSTLPTTSANLPAQPVPVDPAPHPFYGTLDYTHNDMDMGERVSRDRYLLHDDEGNLIETSLDAACRRVATAVAAHDHRYAERYYDLLRSVRFVPGGRVWAGAGLEDKLITLSNCFVYPVDDNRWSINQTQGWGMETLARGGGVGFNFSTLRPDGAILKSNRGRASGPGSFLTTYNQAYHPLLNVSDVISWYNCMYHTIEQGGSRRAACMGQLHVSHPDIERFIHWKADHPPLGSEFDPKTRFVADAWQHFNVSVQASTDFMNAVKEDREWILHWHGEEWKRLPARALWEQIVTQAHASADPGLFFIDRANETANTSYYQRIIGTNPCGEVPLPAFGTCNLGSVNLKAHLTRFENGSAFFHWDRFAETIRLAVRFLDDVLEVNHWPVEETRLENDQSRRLGIGVLGFADVLAELGITYGSPQSVRFASELGLFMKRAAYRASSDLAVERGSFGAYDRDAYLARPFLQRIEREDASLFSVIHQQGMRNACILSIAPTGTISLLAGGSSGIEPIFARAWIATDNVNRDGVKMVSPYALEPSVRTANEIPVQEAIAVQAAWQEHTDQAISRTVNMHKGATVEDVSEAYMAAWDMGCKGITVYVDETRGVAPLRPLSHEEAVALLAGSVCHNGMCSI